MGKLSKRWPEPRRFAPFLDKMGKLMGEDDDWSAEIAKLPMPVLLVFADNDSVPQKHVAEFFALVGGDLLLADPLSHPPTGTATASQVVP